MSLKESERGVRRQMIIDAAQRVLFEKGFENTSMEDIAREAGYTRRTIYSYFKNREGLCLLVFLEGLAIRREMQRTAMNESSTGLEMVRRWGEAFWEFAVRYPEYLHIQAFWDYRGIDRTRIDSDVFERFEALNELIVEDLREGFRIGAGDGSIRQLHSVDMIVSHYAYTLRAVMNKALFPAYSFRQFDRDSYFTRYHEFFIQAIEKRRNHEDSER